MKSGILHTLKFDLHTLSCHFWLNLWGEASVFSFNLLFVCAGIQLGAIIKWSNITQFWIQQCSDYGGTQSRLWTHKRLSIYHPHGWAMGHLLQVFWKILFYNGTTMYKKMTEKSHNIFHTRYKTQSCHTQACGQLNSALPCPLYPTTRSGQT